MSAIWQKTEQEEKKKKLEQGKRQGTVAGLACVVLRHECAEAGRHWSINLGQLNNQLIIALIKKLHTLQWQQLQQQQAATTTFLQPAAAGADWTFNDDARRCALWLCLSSMEPATECGMAEHGMWHGQWRLLLLLLLPLVAREISNTTSAEAARCAAV